MNGIDPAHLSSCALPIATHNAGERWYRIHRRAYGPIFFGPPDKTPPEKRSRFDDPQDQFRVCYFGLSPEAAFAETLLHSPSRRILNVHDIENRSLATILLKREVTLVQLHGPGLNKLDITSDIVDGDYTICGELVRILYERTEAPDGVQYRSRHDNDEIAVALFNRAEDAITLESSVPLMTSSPLVLGIITSRGIGLS